jgi:hypothetical protein
MRGFEESKWDGFLLPNGPCLSPERLLEDTAKSGLRSKLLRIDILCGISTSRSPGPEGGPGESQECAHWLGVGACRLARRLPST